MVDAGVLKRANFVLHIIQALWSVVLIGVLISSLVQSGPAGSAAKYMFAMCWLMIPGLIYLTQAPRFPRTQMFAHPYWVMGINSLLALLWFAAFVSVASYTNKGISTGEGREKDQAIRDRGGCALFPAGTGETEKACTMNRSAVGLGVVMWFLWLGTTAIAGYAAWYFRQHSVSPFEDLTQPSHDIQETTKDAFSPNDEYALINKNRDIDDEEDSHYDGAMHGGRSGSIPSHGRSASVASYDAHPGRQLSWGEGRGAHGIGGHGPIPPAGTSVGSAPHIGLHMPPSGLDMPIAPVDMDYAYHGADHR